MQNFDIVGDISNKIMKKVSENVSDIDNKKYEIAEYGIYMAISDLSKVGIILIISLFLNVFYLALLTIFVIGLMRAFLGGIHANTHIICLITHSITVLAIIYLSMLIEFQWINCIAFPISFIIAYIYSPADNENKPIKSSKQRKRLRIIGLSMLTIEFLITFLTPIIYSNLISISAFVVCVLTTPVLYKVFNNQYSSHYERRYINV